MMELPITDAVQFPRKENTLDRLKRLFRLAIGLRRGEQNSKFTHMTESERVKVANEMMKQTES